MSEDFGQVIDIQHQWPPLLYDSDIVSGGVFCENKFQDRQGNGRIKFNYKR